MSRNRDITTIYNNKTIFKQEKKTNILYNEIHTYDFAMTPSIQKSVERVPFVYILYKLFIKNV